MKPCNTLCRSNNSTLLEKNLLDGLSQELMHRLLRMDCAVG